MDKKTSRLRRAVAARRKITELRVHRLSVFRSNLHIYANIISPEGDRVLVSASTLEPEVRKQLAEQQARRPRPDDRHLDSHVSLHLARSFPVVQLNPAPPLVTARIARGRVFFAHAAGWRGRRTSCLAATVGYRPQPRVR